MNLSKPKNTTYHVSDRGNVTISTSHTKKFPPDIQKCRKGKIKIFQLKFTKLLIAKQLPRYNIQQTK